MFHRVKSEAENDENKALDSNQPTGQTVVNKEANNQAVSSNNSNETRSINDTRNQQQKEAKSMSQTDRAQDSSSEEKSDIPSAAYQRVGTSPAAPAAYSGAPATTYSTYNAPGSQMANASDRRLTIGAGITMSGEIESCDYLLVEGTVEAALKGASILDIAETGIFYGTVEIEDATIAGRFEGDITAKGRLVLREGATVTGTIAYKELEIEAGAVIDGKLTPLNGVMKSEKPAPSASRKEAKASSSAKTQKAQSEKKSEPANSDGSLFSKAATAAE